MRDDFCALILTHGRPDNVMTLTTLRKHGYTGKVYLVVDDEDPAGDAYRARYGDMVLTFSKRDAEAYTDAGDNFPGRRGVLYARNAAFGLARSVGCRYFIALDDDYKLFMYRRKKGWIIKGLDGVLEAMVRFIVETPTHTIAMSQGGDHIGGFLYGSDAGDLFKRKAMNSFVCDVERPFAFPGRINEDTTAYVTLGRRGLLFFTALQVQLDQLPTQSNVGGLTEIYLDLGTYVKSYYSVMYAPSCVKITSMGRKARRLHHVVDWNAAVPKILREAHRKAA